MSGQPAVVKIFVAASPDEWLPAEVLAFSIRETTDSTVEVAQLQSFARPIRTPRDAANRPRTPFSFQRFLIPELCGHQGRAIYLDADMQVFTDIRALWDTPLNGADLLAVRPEDGGRRGQFSVMLLDCARLGWNVDDIVDLLDSGALDYASLMYEMRVAKQVSLAIPARWNSLEKYVPDETALLHYTDMTHQPWVTTSNPLADLWVACLRRAVAAGAITRAQVQGEVEQGRARPSLLLQLDAPDLLPTAALPPEARRADRGFLPPYTRLHHQGGVRGLLRRLWRRFAA